MKYIRKTEDIWEVQGKYTEEYGFERVTAETSRKDAVAQLNCYKKNEPQYQFRIVYKRVRKENQK